jgi:hypothetical protein
LLPRQTTPRASSNYSRLSLDRSRFSCRYRMHEDMHCQVVNHDEWFNDAAQSV